MPIRVKPVHDLGPCLLDMESIKGICALVDKTFHYALYSATDGAWELYDEESAGLLAAIVGRTKLDSLTITAPSAKARGIHHDIAVHTGIQIPAFDDKRKVTLDFSSGNASVVFEVSPDEVDWVDHFMLDLKRHLRKPKIWQLRRSLWVRYWGFEVNLPETQTLILLKMKEPNASVRSIRDNLASSIIYDIAKIVLGIIIALIAVWLYNRFGIDTSTWFTPPGIPTPTP